MLLAEGNIRKMRSQFGAPVTYALPLGQTQVDMNALIGQRVTLTYTGVINCKVCGKKIPKVYGQGFCYPDFMNSPENSPCIINPEKCEGHLGIGRDVAWEQENHVQPHTVYLALTTAVKVGVTRTTQIPTRWIDQGAWKAIRLAETPYRQLAGEREVTLKEFLADKTPWQAMLKGECAEGVDLLAEKARIGALLPESLQAYFSPHDEVTEINYPVNAYPAKVKSLNFDTEPVVGGTLNGIRGQYLLFDGDRVINLRSFEGYYVRVEAD